MTVSVSIIVNNESFHEYLGEILHFKPQLVATLKDIPIESQCSDNIYIGSDNINMARAIVGRLLKSPFDSTDGITLSVDRPYQKKALINITRPSVLRTYYGLTKKSVSATTL